MLPDPSANETSPHGCAECAALVHAAQDGGDWKPVVTWLVRHPECAGEVAQEMEGDDRIRRLLSPPAEVGPGTGLGGFELIEVIGRGTMGIVYRARDRLGREVAVKVVCTAGLSAAQLARVRFEAEAMSELYHPNVVSLFAFGESEGEMYFAMPLLPGTLAGRLKALGPERLSLARVAEMVRDIARGVHHAHQRGLIHRDLKPANILLDKDGVPKIADFGLARRVDATTSVGIAGTFAYMAPEQARGDQQLTTATDVHALGAILFELLTGGVPRGGNVEAILRKLNDPGERAPRVSAYRPDVPADLEAVCLKCLERDPSHRYASAQELADDLQRFLDHEAVLARPRGLFDEIGAAVSRPAEVQSYVTMPAVVFGIVHHPLVHLIVAALVLAGAPAVWSFGLIAYFLAAWLGQTWWFHIRRHRELNAAERQALAFHLSSWVAVVTLVPVMLWAFGPDVVPFYPVLNVVTAAGFFATGFFAGRQYVLGMLMLSQNLALPFVPLWTWPLIHALTSLVLFALFGLQLRRVHAAAKATSRTDPA